MRTLKIPATRRAWQVAVCFIALSASHPGVAEPETVGKEIAPPDVFARVTLLREKLEAISFEMGRPRNKQPEIDVSNVSPREVFFQALTLFRKADRLCFEQTREHALEPETPDGEIRPAHVLTAVDASLKQIMRISQDIGISDQTVELERDDAKTPTDVFRSIVQANRQLNLMLDQRVSPSDVFQQVTLAVSYTSRLLARFPGATRIPDPPEFEKGKRPADVYLRLVGCFDRVRKITSRLGFKILELRVSKSSLGDVVPSDVYDIASLIVSELAHVHSRVPDAKPPVETYNPGRKFPSHVYQRVGILESQLAELQRHVEHIPERLIDGK